MTAAWDVFVASLDVEELRREQGPVGVDLDAERFGSRQHHEMVHAHEFIAADFWRRMRGEPSEFERALRRKRMREREQRVAEAARAIEQEYLADVIALLRQDVAVDRIAHEYQSRGRTA